MENMCLKFLYSQTVIFDFSQPGTSKTENFFLTFIHMFTRFKLVIGHLCRRIEELHMSGKTSLTWWIARCCKTVSLENFYWLIWYLLCIRVCFFRFDASPKKLFVSCHYQVLLVCLVAMVYTFNKNSVFLSIFRYPDKI